MVAVLLAGALLAACGGQAERPEPKAGGMSALRTEGRATVDVKLTARTVTVDPKVASIGPVKMVIENNGSAPRRVTITDSKRSRSLLDSGVSPARDPKAPVTLTIQPGAAVTLTPSLSSGEYSVISSLPDGSRTIDYETLLLVFRKSE